MGLSPVNRKGVTHRGGIKELPAAGAQAFCTVVPGADRPLSSTTQVGQEGPLAGWVSCSFPP